MSARRMPAATPRRPTLADLIILVGASAVGAWGAAAFRGGIPMPFVSRPGFPFVPLFQSIPVAAALTWASLLIPVRAWRERARRPGRQVGMAVCLGAAAALIGVAVRWTLRAWVTPYADGTLFVYGARVVYEWGQWCGLGVAAALAVMVAGGRFRLKMEWLEGLRLALAAYWVVLFLILGAF